MTDLHFMIINDVCEVVGWHLVLFDEDEIFCERCTNGMKPMFRLSWSEIAIDQVIEVSRLIEILLS